MPQVTFVRAGTTVATRIVVIEKQTDATLAPGTKTLDFSSANSIAELFDRMENIDLPERKMTAAQQAKAEAGAEKQKATPAKDRAPKKQPEPVVERGDAKIITYTTKAGKELRGIIRTDLTKEQAQKIDPYTWKMDGGFFIREKYLKPAGNAPAFSRSESTSTGITPKSAQEITDLIRARWANAPEVVVLSSMNDPKAPEAARKADAQQRSQGATGEPEGFFYGGKVYVVASALSTPGDVVRVLFHEALGHAGLRGVFGNELGGILNQIITMRRADVLARARQYGLVRNDANDKPVVDVKTATDAEVWAAMTPSLKNQAAEEVLAFMAQDRPELGFVKRAIAAIRAFLRKNVPGFSQMKLTDADIVANYLLPARAFVERGPRGGGRDGGLTFSRNTGNVVPHPFSGFTRERFLGSPKITSDSNAKDLIPSGGKSVDEMPSVPFENKWYPALVAKYGKTGAAVYDGNKVIASYDFGDTLVVGKKYRRAGIGSELVYQWRMRNPNAKTAATRTKKSQALQEKVWDRVQRELSQQEYGGWQAFSRTDAMPATIEVDGKTRPTANSNGQPIHPTLEGVRNFWAWFGDSRVVDAEGRPLVVYHGTNASFDYFKPNESLGGLIFASETPDQASVFAFASGANVMPVYLKAENPSPRVVLAADEAKAAVRAKTKGYDALRMRDSASDVVNWGVFTPTQIKSATGNTGAFNPEDADIRFSRAGNGGAVQGMNESADGWDAPIPSKWDDYVFKLQDKNIDLKRVTQGIVKWSGQLADNINTYLQEELYHGRAAKRVQEFSRLEMEPALKELAAGGYQMQDLEEFMHARHAKEANAVLAERNPTQDMIDAARKAAKAEVERLELAVSTSTGAAQKQNKADLKEAKAELKRWRGVAAFKGTEEERNMLSGMSNDQADTYFTKLPAEDVRKLGAVAAKFDAIMAETSRLMVEYELESQETVDGWAAMYQHYIPLHREDKGDTRSGTGQGFSIKGRETKGRTGSTRKVVDVLAHIAAAREKTVVRGEKNRVAQALVGMATAYPNEDVWKVGPPEYERVFNPSTGKVENRVNPNYKNLPNVVIAKVSTNGIVKEVAVTFNEDNERAVRMAASLKNLDAPLIEGWLGTVQKMTRYFASINTQYNPVFGVVNLVRDIQGAMINLGTTPLADQKAVVARDAIRALKGIYGDIRATRKGGVASSQWSQLYEQFQHDGGQTGFRNLFETTEDRTEELNSILNPDAWAQSGVGKFFTADGRLLKPMSQIRGGFKVVMDWLSDYNEAMENGVRLAAYKAALDKGMTRQQAASLAKNLTVNFNRKGQAGNQAGAVYAFFNAAMQGTARIGEALMTMEPGQPKTMRLSAYGKKIVYGGITLGMVQALALAAAGFDDEEPPDFVRERSLVFPTGWTGIGAEKGYISVPMPLGLHVIPGIGRMATEFALGDFENPAQHAVKAAGMFMDAFNPIGNAGMSLQTIAPTVLDPLVALSENRDWTGKPIARTSFNKDLPGYSQHKDSASIISKFLAETINTLTGGNEYVAGAISPTPDQIDYLAGQIGGGVWRELSKVEQTATGTVTGEETPIYKMPLVGRFAGSASGKSSEGNIFYSNANKLDRLETEIKGMQKDGKAADAAALRLERPEARLIVPFNMAERQVQKLRKQKSELLREGGNPEQVREIEDRIATIMARMNNLMRETSASK